MQASQFFLRLSRVAEVMKRWLITTHHSIIQFIQVLPFILS